MKTTYLIRHYWRFLAFGFFLTFFCNIGQTFFIGFYNHSITESLGLSSSDFGAIYGIASLMSAASLIWVGRLIDHVDLRWYTLVVLIGVVIACLLMAWSPSVLIMGLSLYFLRLTGQGLMPHISSTSMARYFTAGRGKAISITSLGINASQVILPSLAVGLTLTYGWRESWMIYALFFSVVVIPLVLWMLKGHGQRHKRWLAEIAVSVPNTGAQSRMQKRVYGELFADIRFYIYLPAIMAMPMIGTAFFFFQEKFVDYKNWDMEVFAFSYVFMAVSASLASLVSGYMVDKYSAIKQMPFFMIPFIIGLCLFVTVDHVAVLFVGMVLLGMSQGTMMTLNGTLWPELYGTSNLGAIRSLMVSLMVFGTALTPAVFGFVFDAGVSVGTVFIGFIIYMVIASLMQFLLLKETSEKEDQ